MAVYDKKNRIFFEISRHFQVFAVYWGDISQKMAEIEKFVINFGGNLIWRLEKLAFFVGF